MFGFHGPELIIILVVALLIFGPKKLPEMGSAIGKSLKEFRKGMNEIAAPVKDSFEDDLNLAITSKEINKLVSAQQAAMQSTSVPSEITHPAPVYAEPVPVVESTAEVSTEHLVEEQPTAHSND